MAANGGRGCAGCEAAPWAELTAEMRRIKCATELSYGKLAQRTHYSRSSWERFLNQKQLPTRIAVEQFAAASGQDPRPLLMRLEHSLAHESAARATTGAPAPVPGLHGDGRHIAVRHVAVRQGGVHPGGVRPLGLVVAGALLGGLAAELTRAARLHRPR
ncbi:helix-turn-helix domain-containing protein [Streptomyces sp. NPDC002122]|uniref:helix-turn-helix domain-containing protein n=1 Tax=Streptomyces sp. NPDC002122 TaxID=3154407 RepID=UPI0033275283